LRLLAAATVHFEAARPERCAGEAVLAAGTPTDVLRRVGEVPRAPAEPKRDDIVHGREWRRQEVRMRV
jgi:hypothetical protein